MATTDQEPLGTGFGRHTEPHEVLDGVDLTGRTAVVTGGYSGIGTETTRALAGCGARVVVGVRDQAKAAETLRDVDGEVATVPLDLADITSVQACGQQLLDQERVIDLLILNAGIMACPQGRVGPGWERQIGVNHFGHAALTFSVTPLLARAHRPRVVVLSSIAHRRGGIRWDDIHFTDGSYEKWRAYAQSKTANALFARALSRRLAEIGGLAFSVHPGGIFTPLQRHMAIEEQQMMGWLDEDGEPSEGAARWFKSVTQGASTTLWAATSHALADHGGVYCDDCDIAPLLQEAPSQPGPGVMAHACDDEAAERLWVLTERTLAAAPG